MDISAIHVGQIAFARSLANSVVVRGESMGTAPPSRQRRGWANRANRDFGLLDVVRKVLRASRVSRGSATKLNDLNAGKCGELCRPSWFGGLGCHL